jgi:hypothetical protein
MEAKLMLERAISLPEGDWGPRTLYSFANDVGDRLTWITGSGLYNAEGKPAQAGDTIPLKFTVKKHHEFRGEADTRITRVANVKGK